MSFRRTYTLPSTHDERLRLLAAIERDAGEALPLFGFTVREAHRKAWREMSLPQLRTCADAWASLLHSPKAFVAPNTEMSHATPSPTHTLLSFVCEEDARGTE